MCTRLLNIYWCILSENCPTQPICALLNITSKVVPYLITSVGHRADPGFLTLVINPVVGCCYFPPGPRLLSQPLNVTALCRWVKSPFISHVSSVNFHSLGILPYIMWHCAPNPVQGVSLKPRFSHLGSANKCLNMWIFAMLAVYVNHTHSQPTNCSQQLWITVHWC